MSSRSKHRILLLLLLSLAGCEETTSELFERGYAAFDRGDNRELHDCLKRFEVDAPDSDHGLLLRALVSSRGGDDLTALKLIAQIDEHGPLRRLVLLHGGRIYHEAGRLHDAARTVSLLTREFPDDVTGHRYAGAIYYDLGAYDYAINHLNRVTELAPGDFRPWWLLGTMYLDFDRYRDASDALSKAMELGPSNTARFDIANQLVQSLIHERRYTDALNAMSGVPMTSTLLARKAECYAGLGDHEAASQAVDQSLRLDGNNRTALLCQARLHGDKGDKRSALAIYARLVGADRFDREARYQYSLMLKATGEDALSSENMREWERQMEVAAELAKKNRQALDRPFDTRLKRELAELCEELGKTELAEMWRRAATVSSLQRKSPRQLFNSKRGSEPCLGY